MKSITAGSSIGLLLLLAAASGGDDKTSAKSRTVRIEKCRITLIDHVTLASDRTGILKNVEFKEGDPVAKGTQVALIADEVAKANLAVDEKKATNKVEVEFAVVAKDAAEAEYNILLAANEKFKSREKSAEITNSVSLIEVNKAKLAADKAKLSVAHAEHELELNKLNRDVKAAELRTYSVLSEFEGVVTRIFKKKGEAVKQGDPVAEIVNTDRVRVEGRVELADLRFAKQGARVIVRLNVEGLDLPEEKETFEGKITFVDLVSDPVKGTTRVYAEVQNRHNILRAGLMADMEIDVDETTTVSNAAPENQPDNLPPGNAKTAADR